MPNDHRTVPPPAPADAPHGATPEAVRERLAYLFRASLKQGSIHPLFHLIQQYRLEEHA